MRIVSLLPSATEILFAVGAGDQVVGVTHECDFPPEARGLPVVTEDLLPGGLSAVEIDRAVAAGVRDRHTIYRLDEELLRGLEPDVVVTQALCEVCAVPTRLVEQAVCSMPRAARVVSSDPPDLEGIFVSMREIGAVVGADTEPGLAPLRVRLAQVRELVEGLPQPRVAVLEWPDPPYAPGHWVPDMVEAAGGRSVLGSSGRPSRRVTWKEVLDSRPEVVVLAFCGFDLAETVRRADEIEGEPWRRLTESVEVMAVDGSAYFSRPGPRVVDGVELLAWLLHKPDDLQPPPGGAAAHAGRPATG
ncbi:MAG: cobalamin-binding protein [Acidimicrobiia bacterium]